MKPSRLKSPTNLPRSLPAWTCSLVACMKWMLYGLRDLRDCLGLLVDKMPSNVKVKKFLGYFFFVMIPCLIIWICATYLNFYALPLREEAPTLSTTLTCLLCVFEFMLLATYFRAACTHAGHLPATYDGHDTDPLLEVCMQSRLREMVVVAYGDMDLSNVFQHHSMAWA